MKQYVTLIRRISRLFCAVWCPQKLEKNEDPLDAEIEKGMSRVLHSLVLGGYGRERNVYRGDIVLCHVFFPSVVNFEFLLVVA
jgi:hypothetical protein